MKKKSLIARYALFTMIFLSLPLQAHENTSDGRPLKLKHHEPNFVGYTKDNDDRRFMDFTLSLQHPVFFENLNWGNNKYHVLPYFAFTGRFGQYIGTRDSSPVIAKRFNPKVFFRFAESFPEKESPNNYIDLEYAHESNGQHVNTLGTFQTMAQDLGGNQEFAKDYISRGWDYWGFTLKNRLDDSNNDTGWFAYISRKWYCGCLMQKDMEEVFDWEDPREIHSIKQVSGWRLMARRTDNGSKLFDRVVMILDTGVRDSLQYNTYRVELGFRPVSRLFGVPFVFWYRGGYLSDIAQYHKRGHSYGGAFVFETF